jgi:hypothetical protein
MPTTLLPEENGWWFYRHRRQNAAYKKGRSTKLDEKTTKRFSFEFEKALQERGRVAKENATLTRAK